MGQDLLTECSGKLIISSPACGDSAACRYPVRAVRLQNRNYIIIELIMAGCHGVSVR